MLLHVWYKILPENSSDVANIAFAMRQLSNIVNKILIHLKYLTSYKNDYRIKVSKIEELILHNQKFIHNLYSKIIETPVQKMVPVNSNTPHKNRK